MFDLLNSLDYCYLRKLVEPRDNSLLIVIDEAIVNEAARGQRVSDSGPPELKKILEDSAPIESTDSCRGFEIFFSSYLAYLVTEECAGSCGEYSDEVYSGKVLRTYEKSHFLDHLSKDTGAHLRPLLHYKLVCLNHLIDIAAYDPPLIREVPIGKAS